MQERYKNIIIRAYTAFNARDIDSVLLVMDKNVHWPNGWEGGYVEGHEEVKNYWQRQWVELDPEVTPVSFTENEHGHIKVKVHQVIKSIQGNVLLDGMITHVYTFRNGLIKSMEIIALL
ncbi:MAG: nuclear transport factor 2 family protein [Ginsengibacter sp.]